MKTPSFICHNHVHHLSCYNCFVHDIHIFSRHSFNFVSKCTLSLSQQLLQRLISRVKPLHFERSVFIILYYCERFGTLDTNAKRRQEVSYFCLLLRFPYFPLQSKTLSQWQIICSSMKTHHLSTRTQLSLHKIQDAKSKCERNDAFS